MVSMIPRQLPIVQIRQQPALIGIDADLGTQSIRQPRATYEMQREAPRQSIEQPRGELVIDQSRAWDALAKCGTLEMLHRISSQGRDIALDTIGRIAENGDHLAQIQTGADGIADLAEQTRLNFGEFDFAGPAAFNNVSIDYIRRYPIIQVEDGKIHVNTHPNPVEYEYTRGKLDIYMRQYPKIEFFPPEPQIDMKI